VKHEHGLSYRITKQHNVTNGMEFDHADRDSVGLGEVTYRSARCDCGSNILVRWVACDAIEGYWEGECPACGLVYPAPSAWKEES